MTQVDQPFVVPPHERMVFQCKGKHGDTVLTLEQQIYNCTIREYVEPMFWERQWCYDSEVSAYVALAEYLSDADAGEPVGWERSIVAGQPTRYRAKETQTNGR